MLLALQITSSGRIHESLEWHLEAMGIPRNQTIQRRAPATRKQSRIKSFVIQNSHVLVLSPTWLNHSWQTAEAVPDSSFS